MSTIVAPLIHRHLIVRATVTKPPVDCAAVHTWLCELCELIGMRLLAGPITAYVEDVGNRGVTGVCIISTSHIAVHVWDEPSPAVIQLDVYTCAELDPQSVINHLAQFEPVHVDTHYLDRDTTLSVIPMQ
jgi:S-adenosylmethionine/arginine decarboxylase-like enzyme